MGIELIKNYLTQNSIKPLKKEEVFDLIMRYRAGETQAKDTLIIHNLPYVIKLAYKHFYGCNGVVGFEDLFQQGVLGLMRSLEKFDIKRNFAFTTYAHFWIETKITRYIDDNRGAVRIPLYLQQIKRKYQKIKDEDKNAHNDDFYMRLLACQNEETTDGLRYSITHNARQFRIDRKMDEEDSGSESFQLEDIADDGELDLRMMDFQTMVAKLPEQEEVILEMRMQDFTFARIGEVLNLSRERVRQLEELALYKIKAMINNVKMADVFGVREKLKTEFLKINSKDMDSRIYGACLSCLDKAMKLPVNKAKRRIANPAWIDGECDICKQITAVVPVANYEFPFFEVSRNIEENINSGGQDANNKSRQR